MYGRVTRYFHERGFGFIRGEDDYNAKNIMVIEAKGGKGKYGKAHKKHG